MSEELPDRMPPRQEPWEEVGAFALPASDPEQPPPARIPHLHPTTKVPRIFGIWGTACYGIAALYSITVVLGLPFGWKPPWYAVSSAFLYVFVSAGIIFFGRIESNRDARFFMQALKKRSEENKRRMN